MPLDSLMSPARSPQRVFRHGDDRACGFARSVLSRWFFAIAIVSASSQSLVLAAVDDSAEREFFEKRIRPILVVECRDCHGPEVQEGGLRVDRRESLLSGGDSGPAIVPGDSASSLLWQSIAHRHPDFAMPEGRPKLADRIIDDVAAWIDRGAFDPRDEEETTGEPTDDDRRRLLEARAAASWSLREVRDQVTPTTIDRQWPDGSVDAFLLDRLERTGLAPAPDAPPHVWLRRVWFALVGLPPDERDAESFVDDRRPDARVRMVDRLLASPAFGERWGRHWMDLMRYADSYGHEQDFEIPYAWRYREWLVRAWDADLAYDRFVTEHLAGDLVDVPRLDPTGTFDESPAGTGWWFLHQATHAPVDPVLDEADRIDNQLDVLGKAFLGSTIGCARCHDHKFDPFSTRDYYALAGFLRASRQEIAFFDDQGVLTEMARAARDRRRAAEQRLDDALRDLDAAGTNEIAPIWNAVATLADSIDDASLDRMANELGITRPQFDRWRLTYRAASEQPMLHPLGPFVARADDVSLLPAPSSAVDAIDARPEVHRPLGPIRTSDWFASGDAFRVDDPRATTWRFDGERLELLPASIAHSGLVADGLQGVLRSPTFVLSERFLHLRVGGVRGKVKLVIARYALRDVNPLLFGETLQEVDTAGRTEWRTLGHEIGRYRGLPAYLELIDEGTGYVRLDEVVLSSSDRPPRPARVADASAADDLSVGERLAAVVARGLRSRLDSNAERESAGQITDESRGDEPSADERQAEAVLAALVAAGLWGDALTEAVASVGAIIPADRYPLPQRRLAITDGSVEPSWLWRRGDHRQPVEPVERQLPSVFPHLVDPSELAGSGRLELARALTAPENPLLHRVFVNRVWGQLFGSALVPTVDDFGAMGRPPTHPELLDHLTTTFRNDETSMKGLIRRLCLSRAFGMASGRQHSIAEQLDAPNELRHRATIRRLEGEALRDALLAVSGTLDRRRFGPSVPTYLTEFMGDPSWLTGRGIGSGPLDGDRRRSIWLETRRNFLSPWMITFDLPVPDTTVGRRNASNVPAQALAMLNDPFVRQQAERLARDLMVTEPEDPRRRLERAYLRLVGRRATADELEHWIRFAAGQGALLGSDEPTGANDPQVWTEVCHTLFLLQEFSHVE
ncbi:MAG TPA: PSD1 and planctomycete cytochrome C domain-containing protein [Pirellulaceae bacterium]|nr:PSD1 and planctomycete cytochrome C domain-containing protein [Pirellulaceae bacterium]